MPGNVSRSGGSSRGSGSASASDPLSRPQRLIVGLFILLLVDVIWVASSEFTKYLFEDLHYDKPFFSTLFKISLFTCYLIGFVVHRPWRELCGRDAVRFRHRLRRQQGRYRRILQADDLFDSDENEREALSTSSGDGVETDDEESGREGTSYGTSIRHGGDIARSLSSPTLVPVNLPDSGKSSGTEEHEELPVSPPDRAVESGSGGDFAEPDRSSRRVRFKQLAEVVEMNPAEAIAANLSRLSYNASVRAQAALRRAASRLTVAEVAKISLAFTFPFFAGNYCYQRALSATEAAVVNVLSSTSSIFTLILAGIFPNDGGDRITLSKVFAVLFNVSGVVLVSYSDIRRGSRAGGGSFNDVAQGVAWSLSGSFFYSCYIVLLRRKVSSEDNMDPPMFFGFVGLFSALLLWPGLALVHAAHQEEFVWPTAKQLEFLVVNGLVGTVLSELMWLCGCFYTSSLVATLAIGLTIPLSIVADAVWKQKSYDLVFIVGVVPMFCSFFIVILLTNYHDWDPLMDLLTKLASAVRSWFRCCRPSRRRPPDPAAAAAQFVLNGHEERESLIGIENDSSPVSGDDEANVQL